MPDQLTACFVMIRCGLSYHFCVYKGEKRKSSLLLLHTFSPLLLHMFGDTGTIQASLRFASIGLLLILMRDCKGGKENRTEHASTSLATVLVTQLAWIPRHAGFTDILQSCYETVSGSFQRIDFARFIGIMKFRCGMSWLFINWNS